MTVYRKRRFSQNPVGDGQPLRMGQVFIAAGGFDHGAEHLAPKTFQVLETGKACGEELDPHTLCLLISDL